MYWLLICVDSLLPCSILLTWRHVSFAWIRIQMLSSLGPCKILLVPEPRSDYDYISPLVQLLVFLGVKASFSSLLCFHWTSIFPRPPLALQKWFLICFSTQLNLLNNLSASCSSRSIPTRTSDLLLHPDLLFSMPDAQPLSWDPLCYHLWQTFNLSPLWDTPTFVSPDFLYTFLSYLNSYSNSVLFCDFKPIQFFLNFKSIFKVKCKILNRPGLVGRAHVLETMWWRPAL